MTRTLVTYSGAGGGWSTAAGVAPHSALHFLSPGCQFGAAGETAQVRALRHNGFRRK
jgi:hypothetical protein